MLSKWDLRFLGIAKQVSTWSKDPRRKVGCVLVREKTQVSGGFNGFPRKILDDFRLEDHALKNKLIVHAEVNAICDAARFGHAVLGTTAYVTQWPCSTCTGLLIQAGIKRIVAIHQKNYSEDTRNDFTAALALMSEASIEFEYIEEENFNAI